MNPLIHWHGDSISAAERTARRGHTGLTVWFTGLSGSGKSAVANAVARGLFDAGVDVAVLDADNVRHGLNADLGFSDADRTENVRRLGEVASLMNSFGLVVLVTAISPFREGRRSVRESHVAAGLAFEEAYVATPLGECERRDTKGLYRRNRAGEYPGLSGVDAPYEPPENPEYEVVTAAMTPEQTAGPLVERILGSIRGH